MATMTNAEEAITLYNQGFNCAQALLSVYAPDHGLDRDTALRLAQGFGAGISRTDNLCGQVSSPVMILGLRYGGTQAEDAAAKAKTCHQILSVTAYRDSVAAQQTRCRTAPNSNQRIDERSEPGPFRLLKQIRKTVSMQLKRMGRVRRASCSTVFDSFSVRKIRRIIL